MTFCTTGKHVKYCGEKPSAVKFSQQLRFCVSGSDDKTLKNMGQIVINFNNHLC